MNVKGAISDSIAIKQSLLKDQNLLNQIEQAIEICIKSLQMGRKILFCGNGGSAADAQHIAAELTGKYYLDREPLNAEALNVNSSYLTAVSNDYAFEEVFSRLVKAKGKKNDVLFGLSTSGNSMNVVKAMKMAKEMDMHTISFSGERGGLLERYSDILIKVPSSDTARIQEIHILLGHLICEHIEDRIFKK